MFFLRVIFFTLLRFILLMSTVYGLTDFDVSPLPDWTLAVFSYAANIALTLVCAWLVLRQRQPTTTDVAITACAFTFGQTALEFGLARLLHWYLHVPQTRHIWEQMSLASLFLLALYAGCVLLVARSLRRHQARASAPEGLGLS